MGGGTEGATEASSKPPFEAGGEAPARGLRKGGLGGGLGFRALAEAGGSSLCGFVPPPPPTIPPSFWPPLNCPGAVLLPGSGVGRQFPGSIGTRGVGAEGLECPQRPRRARRRLERDRKDNLRGETRSFSLLGYISEIQGL